MPIEEPGDLRGALRGGASASAVVPADAAPADAAPVAAFPQAPETLVALTTDAALIEALEAVAGEHRLEILRTEAELASHLMTTRASAAILDCAAATRAPELVARLKAQFPDLVLIAAGEAADQAALVAQITDGTVYRFLHKPVSPQRVRQFVEAALKRHHAAPAAEVAVTVPPDSPRKSIGVAAAGAAFAMLAAAGLWWVSRERAAPPATGAPAAAIPTPSVAQAPAPDPALDALIARIEQALLAEDYAAAEPLLDEARTRAPDDPRVAFLATQVDRQLGRELERQRVARVAQLLQLANQRLASGALLEPAGDSASEYIDTARALAPADSGVRAAQRSLAAALVRRARAALDANDAPAAQVWLLAAEAKGASGADVAAIRTEAQRAAEAAAAAAVAAASPAPTAAPTVPTAPTAATSTPRRAGQLPSTTPSAPGSVAASGSGAASGSVTAPIASATSPATTPAGTGSSPSAVGGAPTAAGQASSPAASPAASPGASRAAATPAPAESIVSASTLRQVRIVEPRYPDRARNAGQTGWVDLEFTVRPNGSVGDIRVMRSEPIGVFDEAAREAVGRWRFEAVKRDGEAVAQRARIRVRFTLE